MSVVSAEQIRRDDTRWIGPGWREERAIEQEADRLLLAAEKSAGPGKRVHAAPAERPDPPPPTIRELIAERWIRRMRL